MKQSAGMLLYRFHDNQVEFFLVHPGGPFFAKKNEGWWTIPKGEPLADEKLLHAAIRECEEETGYKPSGKFIPLTTITQKGGKRVHCWAVEGNADPQAIISNEFEIEWPPRSGKRKTFPEIDKAGWFTYEQAIALINEQQAAFLKELLVILNAG